MAREGFVVKIRKALRKLMKRSAEKICQLGSFIMNAEISWQRGYLGLIVLVGLMVLGVLAHRLYQESELLGELQDNPNSFGYHRMITSIHSYWPPLWLRRAQFVHRRLAVEYPNNPWPFIELALLDRQLSLPTLEISPEYLRLLDEARKRAGDDEEAWVRIAQSYARVNLLDETAHAARQALAISPDSSAAQYWLGVALGDSGDFEGAERAFRACAVPPVGSPVDSRWCYSQLLPATRMLTVTLQRGHMTLDGRVHLEGYSEEMATFLSKGYRYTVDPETPSVIACRLVWAGTNVEGSRFAELCSNSETELALGPITGTIASRGLEIDYDALWYGERSTEGRYSFTISDFPLQAYSTTTTVTVVADATQLISSTLPYTMIEGNAYSWQLSEVGDPGQLLNVAVQPDLFNRLKMAYATNPTLTESAWTVLYALPAILAVPLCVALRKAETQLEHIEVANCTNTLFRIFHPKNTSSWFFDVALLPSAAATVLFPFWQIIDRGRLDATHFQVDAFVAMLGILILRLLASPWYQGRWGGISLHLGAIIFACYLMTRFIRGDLPPFTLPVSFAVYYVILMRNAGWVSQLDWSKLKRLFSQDRKALVDEILSLSQVSRLAERKSAQEIALAKGTLKAEDYAAAQETLSEIIKRKRKRLSELEAQLKPPDHISLQSLLFRLGPAATSAGNSFVALGFGAIPFMLFLVLAVGQGEISLSHPFYFLRSTIGVQWGPIYLWFFGYFYRAISGNYGVVKGVIFGGLLAILSGLFNYVWSWGDLSGVELWGIAIRVLITFVFTGLMMDWMTIGYSWKRVRLSYDSPAFVTLITVAGSAVTTVITGLLTGTMSELLSVAVIEAARSFGMQPTQFP